MGRVEKQAVIAVLPTTLPELQPWIAKCAGADSSLLGGGGEEVAVLLTKDV